MICKFVPQVCKAILWEFQQKFRNRWNVSHGVGALDGKHIAIKKPKKSGSEYFNYKGYFSLVLLALVDAEYKFLWVNVGASGSSSDAQIFNRSKLSKKIKNVTLGLPPPEALYKCTLLPLRGRHLCPYSWLVKPYSRGQLTREERVANYRIPRGRMVVRNAFGIQLERFRVMLTTMEQRPKVARDIVITSVVLHNMLRSHQGGAYRPPTPAYEIQPPEADQGTGTK